MTWSFIGEFSFIERQQKTWSCLGEFSVTERQQKFKYDCLCSTDFCRWKNSNFWDFNNLEIYAIRVQLSIKSKKLNVFTNVLYRFLTFLSFIHFCNILIFLFHNIMYNMHFKRLAIYLLIYFSLNHILFIICTSLVFVSNTNHICLSINFNTFKKNLLFLYFDDYKLVLWKEK